MSYEFLTRSQAASKLKTSTDVAVITDVDLTMVADVQLQQL